ncbi:MAG: amidohydrolase [Synergistaceae bacterium]|jgi:5-methylthioadenosine/S-adenosylhomocysteine deaminase|nr:amidohydrolase [Synergistaceae bacterium]
MATLFKDVYILDGERERARRGHVVVSKGVIKQVAEGAVPSAADKVIEGRGVHALLPGFVNAHTHAAMTLLRGLGEEAPLMEWLQKKIWPVEAKLKPEHIYHGTAGGILEMLATGTTCFADMYFEMDGVAQAALDAGIRCALCRGITDGVAGPDGVRKVDRSLEDNLRLFDKWHGREGLLTVQLGPHAPYTVPFDDMKRIVATAKQRGIGIHFHFLETEWELGYMQDTLKMRPDEYLRETGILEVRGAVLAHGVWMNPDWADDSGSRAALDFSMATIVHCPKSNMKLGSGVTPLDRWMDKSVGLALGTDGASSNNRLDIWDEMRAAALVHKGATRNPTAVPALDVLRMATLEGARAFGFANKGLIREGWAADLVLVDLDKPHYIGFDEENLASFIVYAGSSADVRGTMVAGKWLYLDGDYKTVNRDEIMQKALESRKSITS